jgi:hypothetical protein
LRTAPEGRDPAAEFIAAIDARGLVAQDPADWTIERSVIENLLHARNAACAWHHRLDSRDAGQCAGGELVGTVVTAGRYRNRGATMRNSSKPKLPAGGRSQK